MRYLTTRSAQRTSKPCATSSRSWRSCPIPPPCAAAGGDALRAQMSLFLGRETEENEEKPNASRAGHPLVTDAPIPLCARDGLDRLAPLTPMPSAGRGRPCPACSAWVVRTFPIELFRCAKCGCEEGTALCNYWSARIQQTAPLCSFCDPKIRRWHGEFRRTMRRIASLWCVTFAIKMRTKVLDVATELSDPRNKSYTAKLFLW